MSSDLEVSGYQCPESEAHQPRANDSYKVLGIRVDAVQIPDVIERVEQWIKERGRSRYVAVTGMHGVTESRKNPRFRTVLLEAGLVVADGMPLVWLGRWHGRHIRRPACRPEM